QPWVHYRQLRARQLAFDDSLSVRIEVMTRFQVRRNEKNELRIRVIGAGPIVGMPNRITEPGAGGANVRMTVMPIDAPGLQNSLDVAFIARPPNMINDLVATIFFQGFADAGRNQFNRFLPSDL